jgi:CrcB protein
VSSLTVLWVALGGAVGAPARWLVDRAVSTRLATRLDTDFPAGTVIVNLSGSFLLGLLAGLALGGHVAGGVQAGVGTGFCGAYTTFSSWSYETVSLLERGELRKAALNSLGSLAAGLLVAAAGIAVGLAVR